MALLGVGVRLACARSELWLDEIWSLELARLAGSAAGVFTLHHDNNHHLNTLYLLLAGPDASPLVLRLAAVAAGAGSLAVVALRPLGGSRLQSLAGLLLVSLSYLLVHYGSEARGYALAAFFGLPALLALARYLETRRTAWAVAFAATSVLGLLSHLTFLILLLGFAAWAAAELWRSRREHPPIAAATLLAAPPVLALGILWLVDLRQLAIGGTAPWSAAEVLRELVRTAVGAPAGPAELLAWLAVAGAAYEVWLLARSGRRVWLFFATTLLAAPFLVIALRPGYLAPRYFVVLVPGYLLLLASLLARLFQQGAAGRALVALAVVLFLAGSAFHVDRLVRLGRGQYREAFAYLVSRTPGSVVTVGSDHDWRTLMMLNHVARQVPGAEQVEYLAAGSWTPAAPRWVLRHDFADPPAPERAFVAHTGRRYVLERQYGYAGLSGWNWYLYRMDGSP